jgi:hypothetical protein
MEDFSAEAGPPSIHDLFQYYNDVYFNGSLSSRVFVEWSSNRMTSCGGTCQSELGGAIIIRLSKPLLTLRPFSETKNVLLHEMIHAEHFVHGIRDDDASGHGTLFKAKMRSINAWNGYDMYRPVDGYNITVTHSMFEEVNYYRKHHWACEACGDLVRRSMNRPPQEADCRMYRKSRGALRDCGDVRCTWHMHLKYCGGKYTKIGGDHSGRQERKQQTGMEQWLASGKEKKQNDTGTAAIDLTQDIGAEENIIDLT